MRFRGILIWKVGVAVMGVALITFLSAPRVTASTTQGWRVSIGDHQSINVNANNVGTALFQGGFRMETRLDASGNLSPQSVCVGFPEVETTRNIENNDDYSIELRLDIDTCRIVVNDVRRTDVADALVTASSESHEEHWGRAVVKAGEIPWIGAAGFDLTASKVMLDYASSLNLYGSEHDCDVFSPAAAVGIEWHQDSCVEASITRHSTYLKTKTTGSFHATDDGDVWDETIHTPSAEIKGYSNRYVITCKWTPSSIEDITFGPFGVDLQCKTDEGTINND